LPTRRVHRHPADTIRIRRSARIGGCPGQASPSAVCISLWQRIEVFVEARFASGSPSGIG
jgi:hypothetical protein